MKHLEYTRKYLLEDLGCEEFKFAGEYLFCGKAEIYIDRGDDDIIKFHDGKHFIRFICSQRDLTFYYKGDLDMLRISDVLDFDIKIISERFSFKEDELLKILGEIRDGVDDIKKNSIACCKETNKNLTALLEQMKKCCDKKKEVVPEPKPEPEEPKPEEPKEPEKPKEFVCKPMILKVENGKMIADIPDEYKDELYLFFGDGENYTLYEPVFPGTYEDFLNVDFEDGVFYKLAYKIKEDSALTLDGFECLSNGVVFKANEEPHPDLNIITIQEGVAADTVGSNGNSVKRYEIVDCPEGTFELGVTLLIDNYNISNNETYSVSLNGKQYSFLDVMANGFAVDVKKGDVFFLDIPLNVSPSDIRLVFNKYTHTDTPVIVLGENGLGLGISR